jgi:DNA-binding NarL/FixJ family response regulator
VGGLIWTRSLFEDFAAEGMLTNDEKTVLKMKIDGCSRVKIALALHISTSSVDRIFLKIKRKYMEVAKVRDYPEWQ